jgi:hypothetical protein
MPGETDPRSRPTTSSRAVIRVVQDHWAVHTWRYGRTSFEGPIRRPERGSEWEPIKFFLRRTQPISLTSGSSGAAQKTAREIAPNFHQWISQTAWSLEMKLWGNDEHPKVKIFPQKLRPLAPYNSRNHESWPRTLWTRVHPKINESKAKSNVWGVKIIHKEAEGTLSWSPKRNS